MQARDRLVKADPTTMFARCAETGTRIRLGVNHDFLRFKATP